MKRCGKVFVSLLPKFSLIGRSWRSPAVLTKAGVASPNSPPTSRRRRAHGRGADEGLGVYGNAMARLKAGTDPLGRTAEQQAAAIGQKILARHGKLNVAEHSKELLAIEVVRALTDGS